MNYSSNENAKTPKHILDQVILWALSVDIFKQIHVKNKSYISTITGKEKYDQVILWALSVDIFKQIHVKNKSYIFTITRKEKY
jgi:hypothetical protein